MNWQIIIKKGEARSWRGKKSCPVYTPAVQLACTALNLVPDFVTFFLKNFVFLASLTFHHPIIFSRLPSALGLFLAGRQGFRNSHPVVCPTLVLAPEHPAHENFHILGAHNYSTPKADILLVFLMMSAL